jgi:hypothetical protein
MSVVPRKGAAAGRSAIDKVVPFNPLEKKVLGAAIAEVMLTTPVYPLTTKFPRRGPGIYAIYYSGQIPAYEKLAEQNRETGGTWPIYVGQALPGGGRRGIEVESDGTELRARIGKHLRSINAAIDLDPDHFHYRALVMDDAFIRLGETSLLALYKPIWNNYVDGFGNNTPGAGRTASTRSRWDTLHGGRAQAEEHRQRDESRELIMREIERELANTNFDLPATLVNAADQSTVPAPQMDLEAVINKDETSGGDEARA